MAYPSKDQAFFDTNAALRKESTLNGSVLQALSYHEYLSLKEPIEHGSLAFPLKVYEIRTLTWLKERIWCHWHEEIEFVVVTRGSARFQINDVVYDACENDILIVPPNSLHSATQIVGQPFDFVAIVFSPDFISKANDDVIRQKYITPYLNHKIHFPECISDDLYKNKILNILHNIKTLYSEHAYGFELSIKALIYQLWSELLQHAKSISDISDKASVASSVKVNQIKEILAYLKSHYKETIALKDIADAFHLSEGHLCRMFKDVTGKTLTDYLNYYRITMSTALLLKTDMDISQIAVLIGFNNVSYFNKIFKKYMNKTPREFRKMEVND